MKDPVDLGTCYHDTDDIWEECVVCIYHINISLNQMYER